MRCAEYPLIPISYTNAGNNNYSYITNLHTNAVARPIPWAEAVHTPVAEKPECVTYKLAELFLQKEHFQT
jgi:hypothetical protein